jgi:hypothetical protein
MLGSFHDALCDSRLTASRRFASGRRFLFRAGICHWLPIISVLALLPSVDCSPDGAGYADGIGRAARFRFPAGVTTDGFCLYVADSSNCLIRKVNTVTAEVAMIAELAEIAGKSGISKDGKGTWAYFAWPAKITTEGTSLFVTENMTIRKVAIASGEVTRIAGDWKERGSGDGMGTTACFTCPQGIVTDCPNLYVTNHCTIRKVVISTGEVTTIAGSPGQRGSIDGRGDEARLGGNGIPLRGPEDIALCGATL